MKTLRLSLIAVAASALALGAPEKETPPPGSAPKPFKLAATDDFTLPNGMRVTLAPYGSVPKVAVRAYVDAGSIREPADKVWVAKLTALLLKEGTASRSSQQIASDVADMGGQLEVDTLSESTVVGGTVLSEYASQFVSLVADVLANATLPASELTRLRADLVRELAVNKAEPNALARERFLQVLFPDQPYGRSFPSSESLAAYQISDVQSFYSQNFAASRTHLYVVGQFDASVKEAINKSFANWKRGDSSPIPEAKPLKQYSLQQIDRPGAAQSTLYIGLPLATPKSPDYITLSVMNSLLGGSFGSRITSNIREAKGYTYSPISQIGQAGHQSYWAEVADVTTAVTGPSIHEIFSEVNRLRKDPPPAEELKGIQSYLSGLFVLRNTISPDAVIAQLHFVDFQDLNRNYLFEYVPKVEAVSPSDIQRVAETYLAPSKMAVVVAGDKSKIHDQLQPFETAPQ